MQDIKINKMEYRYRVFLAVANNLSFSKAARDLSVSQPAVTTHIKELEKNLGFELFARSGNQIVLTPAGEIVYKYASKSLRLNTELISKLNFLKYESGGILKIGASQTAGTYLLPPVIGKFLQELPQVNLTIIQGSSKELEKQVQNEQLDLAIIENTSNFKELKHTQLKNDTFVGVASTNNRKIQGETISLNKLKTFLLLREGDKSERTNTIKKALENQKYSLNDFPNQLQVKDIETVKNLIIHSDGFGLLPKISLQKELSLNQVTLFNIDILNIKQTYTSVILKEKENIKAERFIQFLSSELS
jgi:DNA-binding transcriptional LysR family regulator